MLDAREELLVEIELWIELIAAAIDELLFTTVVCVFVIFAAREELLESILELRLFMFIAID
jgi:hypothetical protein